MKQPSEMEVKELLFERIRIIEEQKAVKEALNMLLTETLRESTDRLEEISSCLLSKSLIRRIA